jgi:hypothetical protein
MAILDLISRVHLASFLSCYRNIWNILHYSVVFMHPWSINFALWWRCFMSSVLTPVFCRMFACPKPRGLHTFILSLWCLFFQEQPEFCSLWVNNSYLPSKILISFAFIKQSLKASSVCTAIGLLPEWKRSGSSFSSGTRDSSVLCCVQIDPGPNPTSYLIWTSHYFSGSKAAGGDNVPCSKKQHGMIKEGRSWGVTSHIPNW